MDVLVKNQKFNKFKECKLNNKLGENEIFTKPVLISFSFLQSVLALENHYHANEMIEAHNTSKLEQKINANHVTPITLRVVVAIWRCFSHKGDLAGVSINQLYEAIHLEYEDGCSREQFYTEFYKLVNRKLIVVTEDGIIKRFSIAPHLLENERFVLFSPVIFTKAFTDISAAAQKLYFYIRSRINDKSKEYSFKEYIEKQSNLRKLTHRDRPSQFKALLKELADCKAFNDVSLLKLSSVTKNLVTGLNAVEVELEAAYIISYEKNYNYRSIPKAKIPYTNVVKRMRGLLARYNLLAYFESLKFLERLSLIKFLKDNGMRAIHYIISRIYEFVTSKNQHISLNDSLKQIKKELSLPKFFEHTAVLEDKGIIHLITNESRDPAEISQTVYLISEAAHHAKVDTTIFTDIVDTIAKESPKSRPHYLSWLRDKNKEILGENVHSPSIFALFFHKLNLY